MNIKVKVEPTEWLYIAFFLLILCLIWCGDFDRAVGVVSLWLGRN